MDHTERGILDRVRTISLNQALKSYAVIHFLKMKCEGAKFDIFPSSTPSLLNKICEIIMKLHGRLDQLTFRNFVPPIFIL